MGDIAEMMLDGTLCQECGGLMEDIEQDHSVAAPGYPRTCKDCLGENVSTQLEFKRLHRDMGNGKPRHYKKCHK